MRYHKQPMFLGEMAHKGWTANQKLFPSAKLPRQGITLLSKLPTSCTWPQLCIHAFRGMNLGWWPNMPQGSQHPTGSNYFLGVYTLCLMPHIFKGFYFRSLWKPINKQVKEKKNKIKGRALFCFFSKPQVTRSKAIVTLLFYCLMIHFLFFISLI